VSCTWRALACVLPLNPDFSSKLHLLNQKISAKNEIEAHFWKRFSGDGFASPIFGMYVGSSVDRGSRGRDRSISIGQYCADWPTVGKFFLDLLVELLFSEMVRGWEKLSREGMRTEGKGMQQFGSIPGCAGKSTPHFGKLPDFCIFPARIRPERFDLTIKLRFAHRSGKFNPCLQEIRVDRVLGAICNPRASYT
jgi:hypothetical protein